MNRFTIPLLWSYRGRHSIGRLAPDVGRSDLSALVQKADVPLEHEGRLHRAPSRVAAGRAATARDFVTCTVRSTASSKRRHKIIHMNGHKSTRSHRSHILPCHRSSQRAAISTAQSFPQGDPRTLLRWCCGAGLERNLGKRLGYHSS